MREVDKTIYDFRLAADSTDQRMSLEEFHELYVIGKRPPKLLRMLRALWEVKDA